MNASSKMEYKVEEEMLKGQERLRELRIGMKEHRYEWSISENPIYLMKVKKIEVFHLMVPDDQVIFEEQNNLDVIIAQMI